MTAVALPSPAAAIESPRQFFRRHLRQHALSAADLDWYLEESVPRFSSSPEVRLAVEEIVDRMGEFLGFVVTRDESDPHAVWASPGSERLLVRVDDASAVVGAISAALRARDRAMATLAIDAADSLSCLLVVCGHLEPARLDDAVALRHASRQVRLVSVGALRRAAAAASAHLTHDQIVALLRPASALADAEVEAVLRQREIRPRPGG